MSECVKCVWYIEQQKRLIEELRNEGLDVDDDDEPTEEEVAERHDYHIWDSWVDWTENEFPVYSSVYRRQMFEFHDDSDEAGESVETDEPLWKQPMIWPNTPPNLDLAAERLPEWLEEILEHDETMAANAPVPAREKTLVGAT